MQLHHRVDLRHLRRPDDLLSRLPFIDAHVHLWDLDRLRHDWLTPPFSDEGPNGNVAPIATTYLLDDYLAEAKAWNVVGMVHVEAGAADGLAETEWLQDMAGTRGWPNAVVARASLDDPGIADVLAAHARHPAVRGIRHIVNWHPAPSRTYTPADLTRDPAWQRGFALLAGHGLSFDLQAYPGQFPALARLFERHNIQVIVDHAGMGIDGDEDWRAGMAALAALPNVAVKLSGLGFVYRPWSAGQARRRALETIELFGTDRVMIASDFPTDRLFASFDATLGALADAVADFGEEERRAMFARNADRIYRLNLGV